MKLRYPFFGILLLAVAFWLWPASTSHHRRSVIVILIDTLRADHLSSYGYPRATTPHLDALAAKGLRFERAITAAPWTPPSVASIFTGLYPTSHGMMPPNSRGRARTTFKKLDDRHDTLAELFRKSGFGTGAVITNPWITEEFNYHQGFDHFVYEDRAIAGRVNELALGVVDKLLEQDAPFFLYLHYLDPHDPFLPPAPYDSAFTDPPVRPSGRPEVDRDINLYDGEIRYTDDKIKELLDALAHRGLTETNVIVVADHGEQFLERGHVGHGFTLYQEEVWVPLIVTGPTVPMGVVSDTVSTIDLFPTVLTLAGITPPPQTFARSLLDPVARTDRDGVLSEIHRRYRQRALTTNEPRKVLLDLGAVDAEQESPSDIGEFDLIRDPKELSPLPVTPERREALRAMHAEALAKVTHGASTEMEDATVEKLKSLGYLN